MLGSTPPSEGVTPESIKPASSQKERAEGESAVEGGLERHTAVALVLELLPLPPLA
jgi:hypothetical protein